MVLAPGTWKWKGDYPVAGAQFYDDMVYARNNFGAVGFWPLPGYDGRNPELAAQVRSVFSAQGSDAISRRLAPWFVSILGVPVANFFGGWRRELFIFVEAVFLLLLVYAVCGYWIFELRTFFRKYKWCFGALILLTVSVLVLLCLFDRKLRDLALLVFIGLFFVLVAALFARQYFLSTVETDLP
jgi:hypothetical protein